MIKTSDFDVKNNPGPSMGLLSATPMADVTIGLGKSIWKEAIENERIALKREYDIEDRNLKNAREDDRNRIKDAQWQTEQDTTAKHRSAQLENDAARIANQKSHYDTTAKHQEGLLSARNRANELSAKRLEQGNIEKFIKEDDTVGWLNKTTQNFTPIADEKPLTADDKTQLDQGPANDWEMYQSNGLLKAPRSNKLSDAQKRQNKVSDNKYNAAIKLLASYGTMEKPAPKKGEQGYKDYADAVITKRNYENPNQSSLNGVLGNLSPTGEPNNKAGNDVDNLNNKNNNSSSTGNANDNADSTDSENNTSDTKEGNINLSPKALERLRRKAYIALNTTPEKPDLSKYSGPAKRKAISKFNEGISDQLRQLQNALKYEIYKGEEADKAIKAENKIKQLEKLLIK